MPIPATFWPLLAARALVALLCPRWPAVALYAAVAALCEVGRGFVLASPYRGPFIVFVDTVLFVLPSVVLARACGASERRCALVLLAIPLSLLAGLESPELRRTVLPFAVAVVQGASTALGIVLEIRADRPSWERRAAVVLAAVGVLGSSLVGAWRDVAAAGAAAYAFVLLAYGVHRLREDRGNLRGVLRPAVDDRAPSAEASPRAEEVAEAEERP